MLSDIKLKLFSKLSYKEFQIKFGKGKLWPTYKSYVPLFKTLFSGLISVMASDNKQNIGTDGQPILAKYQISPMHTIQQ